MEELTRCACRVERDNSSASRLFLKCHLFPVGGDRLRGLFGIGGGGEAVSELEDAFHDTPSWDEGKEGRFHRVRLGLRPAVSATTGLRPASGLVRKLSYTFTRRTMTRGNVTAHWDSISAPVRYEVISVRAEILSDDGPAAGFSDNDNEDEKRKALAAILSVFGWLAQPELAPVACSKFMYVLKCTDMADYDDVFASKSTTNDAFLEARFRAVLTRLKTPSFKVHEREWREYLWYSLLQVENCDSMRLSGRSDPEITELLRELFDFHMTCSELTPSEEYEFEV